MWIVHRGSATLADNEKGLELKNAECCAAAPPILAFDASGNLVRSWGGDIFLADLIAGASTTGTIAGIGRSG